MSEIDPETFDKERRALEAQVKAQGEKVATLKKDNGDADALAEAISELRTLKEQLKKLVSSEGQRIIIICLTFFLPYCNLHVVLFGVFFVGAFAYVDLLWPVYSILCQLTHVISD